MGDWRRVFLGRLAGFSGCCLALGLFRGFSLGFLGRHRFCGGFGLGMSFSRCALGAIQLVLQLFVEAECLPPAIQLVTGLLRPFLVRAKIKSNITVSHKSSLRRTAR